MALQQGHHLGKKRLDLRGIDAGLAGNGVNHPVGAAAPSGMLKHALKDGLGLIRSESSLTSGRGESVAPPMLERIP